MIYSLLIQTHNTTGLKYLCKTTRKNWFSYKGSGKYWKRHLKMHGRDVLTFALYQTTDLNLFRERCLHYSTHYDVVNNKSWANLIPETGTDGGKTIDKPTWLVGYSHSVETRALIGKESKERFKLRKADGNYVSPLLGRSLSDATKEKISLASKGKPKSIDHCKAMSIGMKGRVSTMSRENRIRSAEFLRDLSSKKYICSVCNKIGNAGQLSQHTSCKNHKTWKLIPQ